MCACVCACVSVCLCVRVVALPQAKFKEDEPLQRELHTLYVEKCKGVKEHVQEKYGIQNDVLQAAMSKFVQDQEFAQEMESISQKQAERCACLPACRGMHTPYSLPLSLTHTCLPLSPYSQALGSGPHPVGGVPGVPPSLCPLLSPAPPRTCGRGVPRCRRSPPAGISEGEGGSRRVA